MDAFIHTIPILIVAGVVGGFLAGLYGIGGGLVVVPALYFLLSSQGLAGELAIAIAIGTSLASIVPTALSSLRAHHRLGNVDWNIVRLWAPWVVVGVLLGAMLVTHIKSHWFVVSFGALLIAVAINKLAGDRILKPRLKIPARWVQGATALVIGFVSAIAGVGGGATGVPAMTYFGIPIHKAVGSCAALGLCVAVPGSLSILIAGETPAGVLPGTYGLFYLPALCVLTPLTIVCAPIGARLNKRLSAEVLNRSFAVLLVVVGVKMVVSI